MQLSVILNVGPPTETVPHKATSSHLYRRASHIALVVKNPPGNAIDE